MTAARFKSQPIKRNGRNCERTIVSKSGIARANIPEPFGQRRLSKELATHRIDAKKFWEALEPITHFANHAVMLSEAKHLCSFLLMN